MTVRKLKRRKYQDILRKKIIMTMSLTLPMSALHISAISLVRVAKQSLAHLLAKTVATVSIEIVLFELLM